MKDIYESFSYPLKSLPLSGPTLEEFVAGDLIWCSDETEATDHIGCLELKPGDFVSVYVFPVFFLECVHQLLKCFGGAGSRLKVLAHLHRDSDVGLANWFLICVHGYETVG